MIGYVEQPRAWGHARGMARVLGVNLPDAVLQGWFSREELAGMVETCATCLCIGDCTAYLARTTRAETLPGFCPNAPAITALTP